MLMQSDIPQFRHSLDRVFEQYHRTDYLASDPILFVHRYSGSLDQEAIALISALLAYGNVKQILNSVEKVIERMTEGGKSPEHFVLALRDPAHLKKVRRRFSALYHRFHTGSDFIELFRLLGMSWEKYGSLGAHLKSYWDQAPVTGRLEFALSKLIAEWKSWSRAKSGSAFYHLLNSPLDGSACKRWCMLIRWMVRKDDIDPGTWSNLFLPADLILPLDTHTARISRYLGLSDRKTADWKMACEVTRSLAKLDPVDPTRYDFALARLGILDLCQKKYRAEICSRCELLKVCRYAQSSRSG